MDENQEQLKQKNENRKARMRAYYRLNKQKWKSYKESSATRLTEADKEASRKKSQEYHRRYYAANRDKVKARTTTYRRKRRKEFAEYSAAWYKANKLRIRKQRKKHYHDVVKPRQRVAKAESDFLTIREAVDFLKAKLGTFREWVYRGQIESVRTPGGRYLLSRETVIKIRENIQHLPPKIRDSLGLTIQGGAE